MNPPALNHVYVVLDAATFAAIRESLELARLLGRSDGGLPDYAPPAPDADRIFFRGRQTYLEIFAPDNRFREPVGKVGLALGYDQPARFDALEHAWRTACGNEMRRTRVEFKRTQPPVPWYDAVQCDSTAAGPDLAVWAMVYRPEFHRWQSGAATDIPPRVARADVLAGRAAAGQGRFDITALEIDLSASLHAKLVKQLEQAGFQREDGPAGTRLRGDGLELFLRSVNDHPGLVSMSVAMDTKLSNDLQLGSVRIVQRSKGSAHLQFGKLAGD
ncbi:DUF5829 family protein [Sphingomonas sp. DT-207]|uniref:DUF5829 family protein n=1 Tax=Sphingomonas sp. DT-207 TaxID=3396167 RepID=UPI003F1B8E12